MQAWSRLVAVQVKAGRSPWESLVTITARKGGGKWTSGMIFFLCAFTFRRLLFPYLEIGHNITWPASLGCFVRFSDQKGPKTPR